MNRYYLSGGSLVKRFFPNGSMHTGTISRLDVLVASLTLNARKNEYEYLFQEFSRLHSLKFNSFLSFMGGFSNIDSVNKLYLIFTPIYEKERLLSELIKTDKFTIESRMKVITSIANAMNWLSTNQNNSQSRCVHGNLFCENIWVAEDNTISIIYLGTRILKITGQLEISELPKDIQKYIAPELIEEYSKKKLVHQQ